MRLNTPKNLSLLFVSLNIVKATNTKIIQTINMINHIKFLMVPGIPNFSEMIVNINVIKHIILQQIL